MLISATYFGGEVYTYTYDAVGNRLAAGANGQVTSYAYDDANRLTQVGSIECHFSPYNVPGVFTQMRQ